MKRWIQVEVVFRGPKGVLGRDRVEVWSTPETALAKAFARFGPAPEGTIRTSVTYG